MNERTEKAIKYCQTAKVFDKTDFNAVLRAFHNAPIEQEVHPCQGCLYGFFLGVQKRFRAGFTDKEYFCILRTLTLKNKRYIMAGHPPNVIIVNDKIPRSF